MQFDGDANQEAMKTPSAQFGAVLACLAAMLLPACGFGGSSPPPPPDPFSVTTLSLDPATLDRMWHADQIDDAVDLLLEHLP